MWPFGLSKKKKRTKPTVNKLLAIIVENPFVMIKVDDEISRLA